MQLAMGSSHHCGLTIDVDAIRIGQMELEIGRNLHKKKIGRDSIHFFFFFFFSQWEV